MLGSSSITRTRIIGSRAGLLTLSARRRREGHHDPCATVRGLLDPHASTMRRDDLSRDVEAQAQAGEVLRTMRLMKPREDRLPLLGRNAHTLIGDRQPDAAIVVVLQSDRHAPTVGAELDG